MMYNKTIYLLIFERVERITAVGIGILIFFNNSNQIALSGGYLGVEQPTPCGSAIDGMRINIIYIM